MRSNLVSRPLGTAISLAALCTTPSLLAQTQTPGDWPMYSLDLGGSRFSPLSDITPRNVERLSEAWNPPVARALDDASDAPGGRGNPQATPIVVDGVMYLPVRGNEVVALEAHTGEEIWRHTLRAPLSTTARGVAYWPGDDNRFGVNVWAWYMTLDPTRDILYMPVASAAGNYWDGDRPGDNLFSNSIVAVQATTGRLAAQNRVRACYSRRVVWG